MQLFSIASCQFSSTKKRTEERRVGRQPEFQKKSQFQRKARFSGIGP